MDKFIDYLFYIWAIALILFVGFLGTTIYEIKKEEAMIKDIIKNGIDINLSEIDSKNSPFVLEGKVKKKSLKKAYLYYFAVPEKIRNDFHNSGWEIVITDKSISKNYYTGPVKGTLAGVTNSKEKKIYINHDSSHVRRAMIHEFGHFVDFNTNLSSETNDFKEIYNKERGKLKEKWKIDNHSSSNSQEYFAEVFQQFLLHPDECKVSAPQSYQYMKNLIENY